MTSQYHRDLFGGEPERRRPEHITAPVDADSSRYAQKAMSEELELLTHAPEGTRNDQLNTAGFNLGQLVASGHLSYDSVYRSLFMVALAIGLSEQETRDTLRSSLTAAAGHPRVVAELHELPQPTVLDPNVWPYNLGAPDDGEPEGAEPDIGEQYRAVDWFELWDREDEEDWIVEPLIAARRLHALFSPPKMGKSLLLLELAVAVARGVPFIGAPTERADATGLDRGRVVLYVDHENDLTGDIRPRLKAMGVAPDMLDNLKYLSFPSMPFLDTVMGGIVLLAIVKHYGAELVVIDTISRAVGGEENDNDTWLAFYRNTGRALKAEGVACVRLDHTGKDHTKGMRGGSAKYGDVDVVWSMTMPSENIVRLECTANRLPVSVKMIDLTRERNPLRHVPDPTAVSRDRDSKIAVARAVLRAVGWSTGSENGSGPGPCWLALREHADIVDGAVRKEHVEMALRDHKKALDTWSDRDERLSDEG